MSGSFTVIGGKKILSSDLGKILELLGIWGSIGFTFLNFLANM